MVTLADVEAARERIQSFLGKTPCVFSESLSDRLGCRLHLKFENLHRTGSFKERGVLNFILQLGDKDQGRQLVTASAGNHGQALALHGRRQGFPVTVVMPEATPLVKVASTKRFGAEVELHGDSYDDALARAREIEAQHGALFVHGFDDEAIIAGAGTMGLEILEDGLSVDALVVPVGGGGLIAGNALVFKEKLPGVKIIGVEPERIPSMQEALAADQPVTLEAQTTLADGLAVRRVGAVPLELVRRYVDDWVSVAEEELANAILVLLEEERTMAEGAGAAGVAALLHRKELREQLQGLEVVVPLCGGNLDVNILSRIIDRGLAKDGRLARFRVTVPDRPGHLAKVTQLVGAAGANILDIVHTRALAPTQLGEVAIDLVVETSGHEHLGSLFAQLREADLRTDPL